MLQICRYIEGFPAIVKDGLLKVDLTLDDLDYLSHIRQTFV